MSGSSEIEEVEEEVELRPYHETIGEDIRSAALSATVNPTAHGSGVATLLGNLMKTKVPEDKIIPIISALAKTITLFETKDPLYRYMVDVIKDLEARLSKKEEGEIAAGEKEIANLSDEYRL